MGKKTEKEGRRWNCKSKEDAMNWYLEGTAWNKCEEAEYRMCAITSWWREKQQQCLGCQKGTCLQTWQ